MSRFYDDPEGCSPARYTSAYTKYISPRDVHPVFRHFARCSPYFARAERAQRAQR